MRAKIYGPINKLSLNGLTVLCSDFFVLLTLEVRPISRINASFIMATRESMALNLNKYLLQMGLLQECLDQLV